MKKKPKKTVFLAKLWKKTKDSIMNISKDGYLMMDTQINGKWLQICLTQKMLIVGYYCVKLSQNERNKFTDFIFQCSDIVASHETLI